ncbi:MAG: RNA polymerase sigma factor, partial [Planctomycetota bacterium]
MSGDVETLARRVKGGDRQAFAELYAATQRELRIFVSAYAASPEMVDEVLQAAYVSCWHSIGNYEPRGTFLAWLKGIARHHLLKALREQSRSVPLDRLVCEEALGRIERAPSD